MNNATPSPPAASRSRREFLLAPVTGLAFFSSSPSSPSSTPSSRESRKRYFLVGEDTELKVYDVVSETLCCQIAIFPTQPIHGISVSEPAGDHDGAAVPSILVWGNQSAAVLSSTVIEERLRFPAQGQRPEPRIASVTAPDWIHDGLVTPDGSRCFLVTAHNQVHEAIYDGRLNKLSLRLPVSPPARPSLYSAKLALTSSSSSPSDLLVACGTVFGEILVWKCSFPSLNHSNHHSEITPPTSEVLFVFTGHEGSVYGVDLSPEISFPDGRTARLLASCSDDRTVRIWDISESSRKQVVRDDFYAARETGFGSSVDLASVGDKESGPVAVGMGHASRIWHAKFGTPDPRSIDSGDLTLPVYSFGEDATTWKWKLHVDGAKWRERAGGVEEFSHVGDVATLSHAGDFAHHDGKHIWAAAVVQQDENNTLIATGGSDGRVNLLCDSTWTTHPTTAEAGGTQALPEDPQRVVLKDLISHLSISDREYAKLPKNRRETFQQFAFIGPDTILAASNVGRVLLGNFDPAGLAWKEIESSEIDPRDLAFSTVIRCPAPGVAVIGTTARKLFFYRDSSVREIATVSGNVTDILCLTPSSSYSNRDQNVHDDGDASSTRSGTIDLLVSLIGGTEPMRCFSLDSITGNVVSSLAVPEQEQHYTATSASLLSNEVLAVGSRYGHLTLFRKSEGQLSRLAEVERRAPDAITSIVPLPGQESSSLLNGRFYFLTTCRDAYYRIWEIAAGPENAIRVRLRHETSSAALPSIEGAWFTAPRSGSSSCAGTQDGARPRDLILTGFRGRRFIVYNETERREVADVDCGGGHRLYDYEPLSATDAGQMRFAFSKTSDLWLHHQREASHATVKTGTHGREIRAVAVTGSWIATGSEDTTIRIWDYRNGESAAERSAVCKADVKTHRAGLQVLKWHHIKQGSGNKVLFSCSGNEEFFVWRVRMLRGADSSFAGLAVVKEAELLDKTPEGDLRIMDFDVSAVDDAGTGNVDGEDDYDDNFACIISMAFSNSTFKTYLYSTARGFHLLAKGQYTGACVTQIRHLRVDSDISSFEILTAASDGHLTVWKTPEQPESTSRAAAPLDESVPRSVEFTARLVTRLHQSNVKALDLEPIPGLCGSSQSWLILTGGDDNALGMGLLSRDEASGEYDVKARAGVKSAHAAAINGLAVLPGRTKLRAGAQHEHDRVEPLPQGQVSFATVSNDQRIKMWQLQWHLAGPEDEEKVRAKSKDGHIQVQVALVADRNSGVADPSDLDVLGVDDGQDRGLSRVMVVGVGMEVWRLGS